MQLPKIGELNRRVKLVSVSHEPDDSSGLREKRVLLAEVWAKCEIVGGASYWSSVNVEETQTHRFYVRYVNNLTRPIDLRRLTQVECEGAIYSVRRVTDVNGLHQFTLMECEEMTNG